MNSAFHNVRNNIWKWLVLALVAAVSIYVCNPPKDKLRFGLEDGRPRTLEEVGKEFDITRERIRQKAEGVTEQAKARILEGLDALMVYQNMVLSLFVECL